MFFSIRLLLNEGRSTKMWFQCRYMLPTLAYVGRSIRFTLENSSNILPVYTAFPITNSRSFKTYSSLWKTEDRKTMLASVPKKDEGVQGADALNIDYIRSSACFFPDEDTPNMLVDGIRFAELPICHIHVTKNNTIMDLTDHKGRTLIIRSCGTEGFKNTKKGTNVAAQITGISVASKIAGLGIKNIRVVVKGLGPGRMASVKGLQMGGMNIVSITDNTPVPLTGPRPRKRKKL